mgnify:CR=1 FL=1
MALTVLKKPGSVEQFVDEGMAVEGIVFCEHRVQSNSNRTRRAGETTALEQLVVVHLESGVAKPI